MLVDLVTRVQVILVRSQIQLMYTLLFVGFGLFCIKIGIAQEKS